MKWLGLTLVLSSALVTTNAIADCKTRTIFKQPVVTGTKGNFCVKCNFPPGHFNIVQWESNPQSADGGDVPTDRDIGHKTGFHPAVNKETTQVSLRNTNVSSGAQMAGRTVGAYINSADLPNGAPSNKFIITPSIMFKPGTHAFNGLDRGDRINVSFDLQVPVAGDEHKPLSTTYVVSDLDFTNPETRASFYVNEMVFHNAVERPNEWVFLDPDTKMAVVLGVDSPSSQYATFRSKSASYQKRPWIGWKHFSYSIDQMQFHSALLAVQHKYPGIKLSDDVADWDLTHWHLNAELLFKSGPAEMGWSMRKAAVTLTSCGMQAAQT
ncbi:hypothetical protein [Lichenicoccus sp.]|uniref:hypothetical protein n=1 Tax=Lichenicoccus sp. TaxID=2781899 RepID=UPI003D0FFC15